MLLLVKFFLSPTQVFDQQKKKWMRIKEIKGIKLMVSKDDDRINVNQAIIVNLLI
jgi:hypothetical protein